MEGTVVIFIGRNHLEAVGIYIHEMPSCVDHEAGLRVTGRHPIDHGKTSPKTDDDWINYWVAYYRRSRQLKKASSKNWNAAKEVWKRKMVQAKRIRCQRCARIVKLWLKTFAYGPEKYMLKESVSERGKTKRM